LNLSQPRDVDFFEAGLLDADTLSVDRPVSALEWQVPTRVWADGKYLLWKANSVRHVRADQGLLEGFLKLADPATTAEQVVRYANRWGVLGICPVHRSPMGHPIGQLRNMGVSLNCGSSSFIYVSDETFAEPIADWLQYARKMSALLRIVEHDRSQKPPNATDFETAMSRPPPRGEHRQLMIHSLVSFALNQMARDGSVRPWIEVVAGTAKITLGGNGLFGAVAVQLLFAVAGSRFARCSACGSVYKPARRPALGRLNFCPGRGCGKTASNRLSQQRRRQRIAQSRT
jgi:hypothetical protein